MRVKLTKIQSTHQNLRTNEIEGETGRLPTIGERFSLFGKALNTAAHLRVVVTTEVRETKTLSSGTIRFETENSTYEVELIRDEKDEA